MKTIDWEKYEEVGSLGTMDAEELKFAKAGDYLEGRLMEKRFKQGDNQSNVYEVESEGKRYYFWGSAVLDRKLAEVPEGKIIAVEYLGSKPSEKAGRTYKDFRVGVGIDYVGDEPRI